MTSFDLETEVDIQPTTCEHQLYVPSDVLTRQHKASAHHKVLVDPVEVPDSFEINHRVKIQFR